MIDIDKVYAAHHHLAKMYVTEVLVRGLRSMMNLLDSVLFFHWEVVNVRYLIT